MKRFQKVVRDVLIIKRVEKFYKVIKSMRYRLCVIKELLMTEQNYIKDLEVVEYLRDNMQFMPGNKYEKCVFMNITQIRIQNQKFYEILSSSFKNYPHQSVLFQGIDVSGFDAYFHYCSHYNDAVKFLSELLQMDPSIQDTLKANSVKLRGMHITDFLIKPVQRLPKYLLLLKDLLKHTPPSHLDKENIQKLYYQFERLNDENNKFMDKFINRAQVKQISDDYMDKSIYTDNQDRLLLHEDTGSIIKQDKELNVRLYYFTDLILVGQMENKLIEKFKIDAQTTVKDQEDTKYFTNLYSIVNSDSVLQFSTQLKDQKVKQVQQIEKMLDYLQQKTNQPLIDQINVRVVGTEERFSYSINKYTIYIIEIQIQRIVLKIYIRFSRAVELLAIFKQRYPNAKFEEFGANHWLDNHSTKVIEQRSISIEKMIQQILKLRQTQPEQIQDTDKSILTLLTLPEDFYDLPKQNFFIDSEIKHQFKSQIGNQQQEFGISDVLDSYFQARGSQIRISTIKDTGASLAKYNIDIVQRNSQALHAQHNIRVYYINNTFEELTINDMTRAAEVVKLIAQEQGLQYFKDFKLILEDKYLNRRVIDDDEVITQLHKISVTGVLGSSINKIESFWTNTDQEKLLFRKSIYLDSNLEYIEIIRDPSRMDILVQQYFKEIQEMKFLFLRDKLYLYTAFYLKITGQELKNDIILKFLGREIYDQLKPKVWEEQIKNCQTIINNAIIPYESPLKSYKYLCQHQFLKQIFKEKESTMNIYKLELHRDTLIFLQKKMTLHSNLFLGLSQKSIQLLSPLDKSVFNSIDYNSIILIKSFPNKLIIQCDTVNDYKEGKSPEWKFVTFQSYEIKMLIQFYKSLV